MENIVKDLAGLEQRLAFLKAKENMQIEEFKSQKEAALHSISPGVLVKKAITSFTPGHTNAGAALDWIAGIVAGTLTRKIYAPKKAGFLKKLTAPLVQLLVTGFVKNKVTKYQEKKERQQARLQSAYNHADEQF